MSVSEIEIVKWNRVLEELMNTSILRDQIKTYLKAASVERIDSSILELAFPNELTKNFVDSSGAASFISSAFLDFYQQRINVITTIADAYPLQNQLQAQKETPQKVKPVVDEYSFKFTFDSFVVGESNQLARGAALAVAERPARLYNPLFIYSRSGLGKTHLLCAIQNYLNQEYSNLKVLYFTARELVDDIVNMSRANDWGVFNMKYTNVDVLLIDDIQYLEGKKESIERVYQLLNDFTLKRKQIVLSADRSPRDIDMDERMTSRFMRGLVVDIQPPTFETKLAILRNYREHWVNNRYIGDDILEYIATISSSNIREIEGALLKIDSYLSIKNYSIVTVDDARDILRDFFPEKNSRRVSIQMVQKEVEKYFRVTHEEIIGPKRSRNISWPRQIAMYLSRTLTDESFPSIGKKFGGRDHTTIMHGVENIEHQMKENRTLYDQIDNLTSIIKEQA